MYSYPHIKPCLRPKLHCSAQTRRFLKTLSGVDIYRNGYGTNVNVENREFFSPFLQKMVAGYRQTRINCVMQDEYETRETPLAITHDPMYKYVHKLS